MTFDRIAFTSPIMPSLPEALELSMQAHRAGRFDQAEAMYTQITQQVPQHPDAWHLLGLVHQQRGNYARGLELIDHAISLNAQVAVYHSNRGETLRCLGRAVEAEAALRHALTLDPQLTDAWNNLGLVMQALGRPHDAIELFTHVMSIRNDIPEVHSNRGLMLQRVGRPQEALADFQRAIALRPNYAQAHNNLGGLLHEQGHFTAAKQAYETAIRLQPSLPDSQNNLGLLYLASGHQEEAATQFRRTVEVNPQNAGAFSNLCLTEQYRTSTSLARLAEVHREWENRFGLPLRSHWRPFTNSPDPQRLLRLGFVSADMQRHPVAALVMKTFEAIDRQRFELYVYSNRALHDEVTAELQSRVDVWREISGRSDDDVAELIRSDQIDLLFDLSGHTAGNRLSVFARKPAPIQLTWIGYVGTTGLSAIDYQVTDEALSPMGVEPYSTEKPLRLPRGVVCYNLPQSLPPVAPPPILTSGAITFGSFNNPSKLTTRVISLWCNILQQTPGSRLILKFRGLDDPGVAQHFLEQVTRWGVNPTRVELRGPSPMPEMLREYAEIDVALDPFPYTGGTTSMLALAMGVPVITCPGETVASRQTYAVLRNIGFSETIVATFDEYVALAARLAQQPQLLAEWRPRLRDQVLVAPFYDVRAWIPTLETALREVWQTWCGQQRNSSIGSTSVAANPWPAPPQLPEQS